MMKRFAAALVFCVASFVMIAVACTNGSGMRAVVEGHHGCFEAPIPDPFEGPLPLPRASPNAMNLDVSMAEELAKRLATTRAGIVPSQRDDTETAIVLETPGSRDKPSLQLWISRTPLCVLGVREPNRFETIDDEAIPIFFEHEFVLRAVVNRDPVFIDASLLFLSTTPQALRDAQLRGTLATILEVAARSKTASMSD